MSFEQLIAKVEQAERALEAQERRVSADVRQLKSSWREAWTPGRIVIAGAVAGFLVGRARPLRMADGGNVLQMVGALAGLFAGGSATPWTTQSIALSFASGTTRRTLPSRGVATLSGAMAAGVYSDTVRITLSW